MPVRVEFPAVNDTALPQTGATRVNESSTKPISKRRIRNCSFSDSRDRQPHCPQTERILKDTTVPVRVTVVLVQGTDAIRNLKSLSPQRRRCRLARKIEEPCSFRIFHARLSGPYLT